MREAQAALPTGTITFLRTDVEGSMAMARALGSHWDDLNAAQLDIIRRAVAEHGGVAVRTEGDAFFGVFPDALEAVRAAVECQRRLGAHEWPPNVSVRVRIGLHAGEAHLAGDDYGGFDVNRAARIAAVGHGGQIVLSDPVRALIAGELPADLTVRDLGHHPLRDVPQPEHLFQLDVADLPTAFPSLRTGSAVQGNLPPRLTSFLGRDVALGELDRLLDDARLLTITGPGGIGKTSLAIELARARADAFPDGAWFVALDSTTDPADVPTVIARTLGLYDGPGRPAAEGLARHLAGRTTLLLLDNFEQVLDAAPAIGALLAAAPGLRIAVTSRAPLHVRGEQEYPVGPLGNRSDGPGAAQLFSDRARSARPGWTMAGEEAVIDEICTLLDGLPLGIELAAARIGLLPATTIRDRLAARLPLPGSGPRDVPDRQRTLDGAIAWSYDLLAEPQQRLLREMAVFEGGFELEQARLVASEPVAGGDVLDGLVELADRSLIERDVLTNAASGLGGLRFRMLETVRTFALRRLAEAGEESGVQRRHAGAMLALAEQAVRRIPGSDQVRWLDRMTEDHANIRAAIQEAVEVGDAEYAQRLAAATWRYWQLGGHLREGRALIDAAIAMPGANVETGVRVWALGAAGGMAYWQGDRERARAMYEEQLALAERLGDPAMQADAAYNLGATEFVDGQPGAALALVERARAAYLEAGDVAGAERIDWSAAAALLGQAMPEQAIPLMHAAHQRSVERGDTPSQALNASSIAGAYLLMGEPLVAAKWGLEAIQIHYALRDLASSTLGLEASAVVALQVGRFDSAATLLGAFEAISAVHGVRPPVGLAQLMAQLQPLERLAAALPSEQLAAAVARGERMSYDEAIAFVVETVEAILADAAHASG